ncbi:head completion/stabilization protein [Sphingomonas hylomeconis]|uniref:Head completion/stabilization protein n=1 Tax=Sphingomonas hylomeconis TaxID=1395958 RepID=A0ABV7SRH5_9SPHN|nr:head completion/stabilization protein [Sphingomonas hylomeconis]
MSGLVVKTAVVSGTPAAIEAVVINDGWFPDIDPTSLREAYRIRDNVTPERLRKAILGAMLTAGNQLAIWQAAHLLAGRPTLGSVPTTILDGRSRLVLLYARAIGAYAKAELVETYRDIDTATAGQRQADELEPSIVELRRDALHAVRDMLGRGRVRVELI